MFWILASLAGVILFAAGVLIGRWVGRLSIGRAVAQRERELFTAQKGFRQLYESEIAQLKKLTADQQTKIDELTKKVEDYRRKAAGYGGLFGQHNKRADAMYALLLENESLEEALMQKNEKLKGERDESIRETMRAASYRRVLMSHILNDSRIKQYVSEVLSDDKQLPSTDAPSRSALPDANSDSH